MRQLTRAASSVRVLLLLLSCPCCCAPLLKGCLVLLALLLLCQLALHLLGLFGRLNLTTNNDSSKCHSSSRFAQRIYKSTCCGQLMNICAPPKKNTHFCCSETLDPPLELTHTL